MDLLPNEIISEIFDYIPFKKLLELELLSTWYHHFIRQNRWTCQVRIESKYQLDQSQKYNLANTKFPDNIDPKLIRIMSNCDSVGLDGINVAELKFLSNVREINFFYGKYAGSIGDLKYLTNTQTIRFGNCDHVNAELGLKAVYGPRYLNGIHGVKLRKCRGKVINNWDNFYAHTTRLFTSISSYIGCDILRHFDRVKTARIHISMSDSEPILKHYFDHNILTKLTIENSHYIDDSEIKCLTNLENLTLYDCGSITGIAFAHLINLRTLFIEKCHRIRNHGLKNIGGVTKLSICDCDDIDHNSFKYFTRVKKLRLVSFDIRTIEMEHLARLEKLTLTDCTINASSTSYLSSITKLGIYNCSKVTDDVFSNLPQLTKLKLSRCANITARIFEYMPNLLSVMIFECKLITHDIFQYLRNVQVLDTVITPSAEDLAYLPNIRDLSLAHMTLTRDHLVHLTGLERLFLHSCEIVDFDGTIYFRILDKLILNECPQILNSHMKHFVNATDIGLHGYNRVNSEGLEYINEIKRINITSEYFPC